ncbi:MAG: OmpA family protein [Candidatus Electrothrix sp. AR3]|nr:OmpA family protein [Candidatus Electrothrix sp. AR3]
MISRTSQLLIALLVVCSLALPSFSLAGGKKPGKASLTPIKQSKKTNKENWRPSPFPQLQEKAKHIRMADNFFVFYDPSTAMTVPYKNSGISRLEMSKQILLKSNATLPELNWQTGLYPHWKNVMWLPSSPSSLHPYYRLQNYDRQAFGTALEKLPVISSGPPMLQTSLMKLEHLLGLPGRTEVFLFSNGAASRFEGVDEPEPLTQAKMLAEKYDVCFTIISSATNRTAEKLLHDISKVNDCSQVIDFDTVAAHPEHLFGRLYMTPDGLFENVLFAFDRSNIRKKYRQNLNKLGRYLVKNPDHYAVLSGFCDILGTEKYNLRLSQRRAENAQKYLLKNFPLKKERVLLYWYGYAHPVASNKTVAGRRLNRRVTVMIRKGF